jgi:hypothetical protein
VKNHLATVYWHALYGSGIVVYWNDGSCGFATTGFSQLESRVGWVTADDFNGNCQVDLVVSQHSGGGEDYLLLNHGGRTLYDALGNRIRSNAGGVVVGYTTNGMNQYTGAGDNTKSWRILSMPCWKRTCFGRNDSSWQGQAAVRCGLSWVLTTWTAPLFGRRTKSVA